MSPYVTYKTLKYGRLNRGNSPHLVMAGLPTPVGWPRAQGRAAPRVSGEAESERFGPLATSGPQKAGGHWIMGGRLLTHERNSPGGIEGRLCGMARGYVLAGAGGFANGLFSKVC